MLKHEEVFYNFQTKARGLLSKDVLEENFIGRIPYYDYHIAKYLPKDKNSLILDIPCGFGNFLYYLRHKGFINSRGCDLDIAQIELARSLCLDASVEDALKFLGKYENVDLLASIDFLEHLTKDEAIIFLGLCYEKLAYGGVLIIKVPSADGFFGNAHLGNDITHKWALTSIAWKKAVLPMLGFNTDKIDILDDRIRPTGIRRIVYFMVNKIVDFIIKSMGMAPPAVYSRSMIIVARK